jgi:hypothetical protein
LDKLQAQRAFQPDQRSNLKVCYVSLPFLSSRSRTDYVGGTVRYATNLQ